MITYEVNVGTSELTTAETIADLAFKTSQEVEAEFNGFFMTASPGEDAKEVLDRYFVRRKLHQHASRQRANDLKKETFISRAKAIITGNGSLSPLNLESVATMLWYEANQICGCQDEEQ